MNTINIHKQTKKILLNSFIAFASLNLLGCLSSTTPNQEIKIQQSRNSVEVYSPTSYNNATAEQEYRRTAPAGQAVITQGNARITTQQVPAGTAAQQQTVQQHNAQFLTQNLTQQNTTQRTTNTTTTPSTNAIIQNHSQQTQNVQSTAQNTQGTRVTSPPSPVTVQPTANITQVNSSTPAFSRIWDSAGFSTPDSLITSSDGRNLYVSNIAQGNAGFISQVNQSGSQLDLQWVSGLTKPAGLALSGNTLYVAAQTSIYKIDTNSKRVTDIIRVNGGRSPIGLNSIVVTPNEEVFAADVLTGIIYTITNNTLVPWFQSDDIPYPNSLLVKGNTLLIANYAKELAKTVERDDYGSIFEVNISTKAYNKLLSSYRIAPITSVAPYQDGYIINSSQTGEFYFINSKNRVHLNFDKKGVGDIFVQGDTIYLTLLFQNQVEAYKINNFLQ